MTYEAAPATKMLATHCAACARPLLDAASVTAGIGPECRRKYGLPDALDEDTRERANKLIYRAACEDATPEVLSVAVIELSLMGCDKLAARIAERAGRVAVERVEGGEVAVTAPFSEVFLRVRGRGRWHAATKTTRYRPEHAGDAVRAVIEAFGLKRCVRVGDGRWVRAEDLLTVIDVPADIPTEREPEPKIVAQYRATPSKTRAGGWGACVQQLHAKSGDVVEIKTTSGKTWLARLVERDARRSWGDVWTTARV